ncbi:MAG TPA: hypothetical protein VFW66_11845 [Gemmatimonadales bacterium]|nr:hypothetical protein [Gemmatimonadales bacterium]
MTRLWLFLHLLGFTLWIGGGFGVMVSSIAARNEDRARLAAVVRAHSAVYRLVIGPAAIVTVVAGLVLTLGVGGGGLGGADLGGAPIGAQAGLNAWLLVMQVAGILAAVLTLFVSVPTAARLARLDAEASADYFDELRGRQRVAGAIWGALGLLALVAGAIWR